MKTKLTLTVPKNVIESAKRYSKKTGKSLSKIFEEFFENEDLGIKSEPQRAAGRLLEKLEKSESIETLNDKPLLRKHVARKYT